VSASCPPSVVARHRTPAGSVPNRASSSPSRSR
jgi:hypothetical protein